MKYDIKFNEWQEMSLKKDVEKILSTIKDRKEIELYTLIEIFIALVALILDQDNGISKNIVSEIILSIAIAIPLIILGVRFLIKKWKRHINIEKYTFAKTELVNDFDNKVCYWVMTATSFCDLLKEKMNNLCCNEVDVTFLFQEANFYVNKSIEKFREMGAVVDKIFINSNLRSKQVNMYRLKTIISIMNNIRTDSNNMISELKINGKLDALEICIIDGQIENNNSYDEVMEHFLDILHSNKLINEDERSVLWKHNTGK